MRTMLALTLLGLVTACAEEAPPVEAAPPVVVAVPAILAGVHYWLKRRRRLAAEAIIKASKAKEAENGD